MRSTPWTTKHDQLLRDSAPEISGSSEAELTRIWNRVDTGQRVEAPRRRRSRLVVGAAAAAAVLATSAVAAADLYSAHTGRGPIDAEDLRLGGPGERLDPGAPDFADAVEQLAQDIPFPDGAARDAGVQVQLDDQAGALPGAVLVSTGALRAWLADAAVCTWGNQWAAATRTGDSAKRGEAIQMIQEAPTWPAVAAIDPYPSNPTTNRKHPPRRYSYPDASQFYYLVELGTAVEGERLGLVAGLLARNNAYCRPGLVPDLPRAWALHPRS